MITVIFGVKTCLPELKVVIVGIVTTREREDRAKTVQESPATGMWAEY